MTNSVTRFFLEHFLGHILHTSGSPLSFLVKSTSLYLNDFDDIIRSVFY